MSTHPTLGISGAKPRLPKAEGNGAPSKEELARLSREYLEIRNRGQAAKAFMAETQAARQRGELIPRKTVFDTLAHYMTVFRQRSLLAHRSITQRLVTLSLVDDAKSHAVSEVIGKEIRALLNELGNLPDKATDPNWIDELAREEIGFTESERQQTPSEHKRAEVQATRRREKKTETMRELRARA